MDEHFAWNPDPDALQVDLDEGPGAQGPSSLRVQHIGCPFLARVAAADSTDEEVLQAVAHRYLAEVCARNAEVAGAIGHWVEALSEVEHELFGWMPIDRGGERLELPGSTCIALAGGGTLWLLSATQRLGARFFLGSQFGLRVGVRVDMADEPEGPCEAVMRGFVASLPHGVWKTHELRDEPARLAALALHPELPRIETLMLAPQASQASNLQLAGLRFHGLRIALVEGQAVLERRYTGVDGTMRAQPWAATFLGASKNVGTLVRRERLVAHMAEGEARVFGLDPLTRSTSGTPPQHRPSRDEDSLDPLRHTEVILDTASGDLVDPGPPLLRIMRCPAFVPEDFGGSAADPQRSVHLKGHGGPALRSNDAAAVQAYRHARSMLQLLRDCGIDLGQYFSEAKPQIDIFYRSGISPGHGKDGRTVNARVLPQGWTASFYETVQNDEGRPVAQVHLGLGDLLRRDRRAWVPGGPPQRAQWLGIAADVRWMWHEFAHVLLLASTGELELRFAHSPGDALAAIAADPQSQAQRLGPRWRFVTFPWVMLPRRHDRCVAAGWGWNGPLRAAVAALPPGAHPCYKGYESEQILSSTLFRLYRCLGGDSLHRSMDGRPDPPMRARASRYTVSLVIRALQWLGSARVVPAHRPEDFAFTLMLTDALDSRGSDRPISGCAWKVVRWAFEAQGLYTPSGGDVHAPGAPPAVDVYIASGRPEGEDTPHGRVEYGPGSYLPVSLHWQVTGDPAPAWQASAHAVTLRQDGSLQVRVGNRGTRTARGVTVQAWWAAWPSDTAAPHWPATTWHPFTGPAPAPQDITSGAEGVFTAGTHVAPAGRYVVLAAAGCAADPSNLDPSTRLACSREPTLLAELVAGDNNLALRVVGG